MTPLEDTVTVAVRGPGDNFGEMALAEPRLAPVGHGRRSPALGDDGGLLWRVRRSTGQHPQINRVLTAFLAGEIRRQNELLLDALQLRRLVELERARTRGIER
jgi:hypothetical protein